VEDFVVLKPIKVPCYWEFNPHLFINGTITAKGIGPCTIDIVTQGRGKLGGFRAPIPCAGAWVERVSIVGPGESEFIVGG
jgi:hypothetical protein